MNSKLRFKVLTSMGNIRDATICDKGRELSVLTSDESIAIYELPDENVIYPTELRARDVYKRIFQSTLRITMDPSKFQILKKMYSDHFLVGEKADDSTRFAVHLLGMDRGKSSITNLGVLEVDCQEKNSLKYFRLLRPRLDLEGLFAVTSTRVNLIFAFRSKLYLIRKLDFDAKLESLFHLHNNTWISELMKTDTVVAVTVEFPKALRVC